MIFFYRKTRNNIWNRQYTPYTSDYVERQFKYVEQESGRRYRSADLSASGLSGGGYVYEWNGIISNNYPPMAARRSIRDLQDRYKPGRLERK